MYKLIVIVLLLVILQNKKLTDIKHGRYFHVFLYTKLQDQIYKQELTKRLLYVAGIPKTAIFMLMSIIQLYFELYNSRLTFRHIMPLDKTVSA